MPGDLPGGPVLVGYRPGKGVLAQSVRDFDQALAVWRSFAEAIAPGAWADFEWWIAPDSNPVVAGSAAMAREQEAARAAR